MKKLNLPKWLIMGTSLLIMAVLILYGYVKNPSVTLSMCLQNPIRYHQHVVELGNEAIVASTWDGGFTLRQMGLEIPVYGDNSGLRANDFIYVKAIFHQEGYLELLKVRAAKLRRAKVWTSIPPMLVIICLFIYQYRFNLRTLQLEERKKCRTW